MKTGYCKITALLGCMTFGFAFVGDVSACGCDIVEKKTALTVAKGQYELDLGKLSAESATVAGKANGGSAADNETASWERELASLGAVPQNRGCSAGDSVHNAEATPMAQGSCTVVDNVL